LIGWKYFFSVSNSTHQKEVIYIKGQPFNGTPHSKLPSGAPTDIS